MAAAVTQTPGVPTGYSHPKCYARATADCSTDISGEHAIARGVLERMSGGAKNVEVGGLLWMQGNQAERIGIKSLTANVLCSRHNSALSALDAEGIRFLEAFDRIRQEFGEPKTSAISRVFAFDGHDIERWLLKMLCGLRAARSIDHPGNPKAPWQPRSDWLDMLFGRATPAGTMGLYFVGQISQEVVMQRRLEIGAVARPDGELLGAILEMYGYRFVLAMVDVTPGQPGSLVEHGLLRPSELIFTKGSTKRITFSWRIPGSGTSVTIKVQ